MRCEQCKHPLDADDPQALINGTCPHCGSEAVARPIDSLAWHVQKGGSKADRPSDVLPFETPRKRKLRAAIVIAVCALGIAATLWAKDFGRSLPKVVKASDTAEPNAAVQRANPPAEKPTAPAGLGTLERLEYYALLAEQKGQLADAVDWYDQILTQADNQPRHAAETRTLVSRVRKQRDLLIAWQMMIKAGQPDATKPTSLESIFDR